MVFYVCRAVLQKVDRALFLPLRRQSNSFACLCWTVCRVRSCATLLLEVINKVVAIDQLKWKLLDFSEKKLGVKERSIGKTSKINCSKNAGIIGFNVCLMLYAPVMKNFLYFFLLLCINPAQKMEKYDYRNIARKINCPKLSNTFCNALTTQSTGFQQTMLFAWLYQGRAQSQSAILVFVKRNLRDGF